jgi:3-isopropylmalate dehydrogenase
MRKKIALMPGDGIGPTIIKQTTKVLEAVAETFDHSFDLCYCDIGASAIQNYGDPLPETTLETCKNADAAIIGAVGHPDYDNAWSMQRNTPDEGLLKLRKSLDLYLNIRPVITFPLLLQLSPLKEKHVKGVDFVIYRELSSGVYYGEKGRTSARTAAFDQCYYSKEEISRVAKRAFETAKNRKKKKLTLVDKANVMETSRLWREVVYDLTSEYPEVELNTKFIDHAVADIILNPKEYDVILAPNLFGDILSDAAGVITGTVRLIPSGSFGDKHALFEPIYSAHPEKMDKADANPIANILSISMMFDYFDMRIEAKAVRNAVTKVLRKGYGTPDLNLKNKVSAAEIGDSIANYILENGNIKFNHFDEGMSTII